MKLKLVRVATLKSLFYWLKWINSSNDQKEIPITGLELKSQIADAKYMTPCVKVALNSQWKVLKIDYSKLMKDTKKKSCLFECMLGGDLD